MNNLNYLNTERWLLRCLLLLALLGLGNDVLATEMELPIERMAKLFDGDADGARLEFTGLLSAQLDELDKLGTDSGKSQRDLYYQARLLRSTVMTVHVWEGTELWLVDRSGKAVPEDVATYLVNSLDILEKHADYLQNNYVAPSKPDHRSRDIEDAIKDVGVLLLRSNIFVRHTHLKGKRQRLIDRGQHKLNMLATKAGHPLAIKAATKLKYPKTVKDVDSRYGTEHAQRAFSFRRTPPKDAAAISASVIPTNGGVTGVPEPHKPAKPAVDPALETLARNYFEYFIAGDIDGLESLWLDGRLPLKDEIRSETLKFSGWALGMIESIYTRPLGNGDLLVSIEGVELVDAEGNKQRSRDTIVVRRIDAKAYKIVSLEAARAMTE